MNALDEPVETPSLESLFEERYVRIARVIAGVLRDPGRAEELAVEVFLRWDAKRPPHSETAAWLHRVAVRLAIDELRRIERRKRFESLLHWFQQPATPEEIHSEAMQQKRLRQVLARMRPRDAELIVLRSEGFSYEELGGAMGLNPSSVGTLLARAQQAFRTEYVRRYGSEE